MDPIAGVCRNVTSVCHQLARSTLPSMASTSRLSSIEGSTGCASVTVPSCRAKSACCSAVSDWSRKKITWWATHAWRTAASTSGASGTERSTPEISAPILGEIGCTPMLVARVTLQFCPKRPSAGAPTPKSPNERVDLNGVVKRFRRRRRRARCRDGRGHPPGTGGQLRQKTTSTGLPGPPPPAHAYIGQRMSDDTVTAAEGLFLAPPARNYSPWYQWMSRLAATTHEDPLPEGDPEAIPGWLEGRRQRLAELLGPQPQPVPLNTETLESTQCDGYRRNMIVFDTEEPMSVPAYLLVPADRAGAPPGPAVLACHGHGPGKSQAVGLEHTDMPNADYALQLARRGYVVLAPDLRFFGERRGWDPEDHYACDTNLVHAAMAGWKPLAQNIWDLRRSLDVLEQHPLVDPARLGMVGISYGGTVTLFTAAVDTRVAGSVVGGSL